MVNTEEVHHLMLVFLAEKSNPDPRTWHAPDHDVYGHCLYEFHCWLKHRPETTALLNGVVE